VNTETLIIKVVPLLIPAVCLWSTIRLAFQSYSYSRWAS